ncbi:terpene synthase family protein [Amycolatopsis panacis]|uniref:Terpene synthase n=1 Tax=Amycolatopsis panacis TaxID=2340917 RepID=A0A419I1P4_9PSEU|nr:terpene synthase [Amycolatopsis panacis]RJQ83710.1 terpene synthase [Amycolatopsis panacis]
MDEDYELIQVPAVWCPIPEGIHPQWRALHADAVEWMDRLGIYRDDDHRARNAASGAGELAARVAPGGTEDALRVYTRFLMWLFSFDDGYCSEGMFGGRPQDLAVVTARMLRVAETPAPDRMFDDDPWTSGLRDIRLSLDSLASPAQISRWVMALRMYLFSQVWEASHRSRGSIPDLNDYVAMRIFSGSLDVCASLLDVVHGCEAGVDELCRPEVRALTEMMSLLVSIDNDLMSYHKEINRSGDPQRVLDLLMRRDGCTLDEAVRRTVGLRDRILLRYLTLRDEVAAAAGPSLRRYLAGLDGWIRGNLDWGRTCARYLHLDNPISLPTHFAETPSDGTAGPLPIPTVSWWWQDFRSGSRCPAPALS